MAKQWLSASDPYWSQFTQDLVDGSYNPYGSTIAGLESLENWGNIARQLGFTGPIMGSDPDGSYGYTTDFYNFVQKKKAEGYDFVVKSDEIDKRTSTFGLRTPSGEVVAQRPATAAGFGEFFKEFVLPAAGAAFTMGGGLNALMGGGAAAAPANALTGAGIGGLEGAAFADLAAGMLPEFGTSAAYSAGLSGGTGLGGALTLQEITGGLSDVLGAASDTATGAGGVVDVAGAEGLGGGLTGADRAALYGNQGYGAGMTGAQTSAYDTTLGLTGSKPVANVVSNVVGTVNPILSQAIDLLKSPAGQAVVGGVGSVVGGVMQANAAEAAADQQAEAARNALQLQRDMFEYQKELLDPYRKRGEAALTRLSGALGLEGPAQPQQMLEMDPGYGFRLGEGMKALERMQSARGSMLSGGAMKAGTEYAQKFASGEYQNAYNRLANIAGLGQTVGGQLGTAAQQFGTSAGNVMGQEANALAAGRYGRTSAYTDALSGVLGAYENYLNRGQRNQLARDIYGRMLGGGS